FTFIQLLCLAALWIIKVSAIGILFPLAIAALVPVRFALNRIFASSHLELLDAEEVPTDEQDRFQ
ncbi:MAG: hypothetical protein KDA33_13895, partial [Phycisphaerales bacterium]|nr:hypothetical protein [Phycisphaerales bacterium]